MGAMLFTQWSIYPAHAGINLKIITQPLRELNLPRTRGDKPKTLYQFTIDAESTRACGDGLLYVFPICLLY